MPIQTLLPRSILLLLTAASVTVPAQADEEPKITFETSTGLSGDSNVGAPQLDQSTGQGDIALLLGGKIQLDVKPANKLTLRGGYEFNQTSYQDFDAFDLQTHRGFAEAEYDFSAVKAGFLANYAHARLNQEGYLDYTQISPNISRLFGNSVYLRAAFVRTEKDFKTDDSRDADENAGRLDVFFFLDDTRQYVTLGGEVGEEDAESDAFDRTNTSAKARFIQRMPLLGRDTKVRIGGEIEKRDYDAVTPSISEAREDRIVSAESDLEIPLYGPVFMDVGYEYRDRNSNLESADYDEHVGSVELRLSF
ncbi:hypothetical protein [Henriciella sp.]|uniref:hypothetical protein n=1 Tax=Henriciella sp. TaxID=1968823 RepID=UPI002602697E|nr:hypothetical protein [Henriciella sp.]